MYNEDFIRKFLAEKTTLQSIDNQKKHLIDGVTVERRISTPKKPPPYTSLKKPSNQGITMGSHATTVASLTSAGGEFMPPLVSRNSL